MDTIIQEASHGSPILAYGSASASPKKIITRILLFVIGLIVITGLFFAMTFLFGSANMPSRILFAIATVPSKIDSRINGALISELPAPWRAALETESRSPVIIGFAQTKDNGIAPFAILARTVLITAPEHTTLSTNGLIKVIASDSIELKKEPYSIISSLLRSKKNGDASWMISFDLLKSISGNSSIEQNARAIVYGDIHGTRGEIFLPSEEIRGENTESAFFVILGERDGSNRILSSSFLSQGLDIKDVRDPNQVMMTGDGSLTASWSTLSEDEQRAIAVASGHTTGTPLQLPDSDLVSAIGLSASGTQNEIVIENAWKQASGESDTWKSSCPGNVRFSINGEALQNLLFIFKTPESWRERIRSFAISTDKKSNIFCINE